MRRANSRENRSGWIGHPSTLANTRSWSRQPGDREDLRATAGVRRRQCPPGRVAALRSRTRLDTVGEGSDGDVEEVPATGDWSAWAAISSYRSPRRSRSSVTACSNRSLVVPTSGTTRLPASRAAVTGSPCRINKVTAQSSELELPHRSDRGSVAGGRATQPERRPVAGRSSGRSFRAGRGLRFRRRRSLGRCAGLRRKSPNGAVRELAGVAESRAMRAWPTAVGQARWLAQSRNSVAASRAWPRWPSRRWA